MKTRIVAIGNSHGVRIPKPLLEETGLSGEVEISAQRDCLVIRPIRAPRAGWAAAFEQMREHEDDALLDGDLVPQTRWDADEWEW
jgi:antitoxin MazE